MVSFRVIVGGCGLEDDVPFRIWIDVLRTLRVSSCLNTTLSILGCEVAESNVISWSSSKMTVTPCNIAKPALTIAPFVAFSTNWNAFPGVGKTPSVKYFRNKFLNIELSIALS